MVLFIEFCYSDRARRPITGIEAQNLQQLCISLNLLATAKLFEQMQLCIRSKIEEELLRDLETHHQYQPLQYLSPE